MQDSISSNDRKIFEKGLNIMAELKGNSGSEQSDSLQFLLCGTARISRETVFN